MARHVRQAPIYEYQPLHITATATQQPVGGTVNTTSATTITAGSNVVVTPASMNGIQVGMVLNFANGTGSAEDVIVKSLTSTTFKADFLNNHSGGYTICSRRATHLGVFTINQAGTGVTITLYNGSPNVSPAPGAPFAVLTGFSTGQSIPFYCVCDKGLYYTVAGTAGDYTLTYVDG